MDPIVTINPNIMHSTPCFAGTRVAVQSLFDHLEAGYTVEGFIDEFLTGKREQVSGLLAQLKIHAEQSAVAVGAWNLLDENLPHKLRLEIPGHEVVTAAYVGWSGIEKGKLLFLAAAAGFGAFITNDQGLEYQQNQDLLPVPVIVLLVKANAIEAIRPLYPELIAALGVLSPGKLIKVGN